MTSGLLLTFLLATPAAQEEIVLVDGRILSVDRISSETFTEVVYRTKSKAEGRKPADQVRELRHNLGNDMLDDYAAAIQLMKIEDYVGAIQFFEGLLSDDRLLRQKRFSWVLGDSLWRQVVCRYSLSDFASVPGAVDRLLEKVPDTFYYAPALMAKAEALELSGNSSAAVIAFQQLQADVTGKGLPARWAKEAELSMLLLDKGTRGATLRRKLDGLFALTSSSYPSVASRCKVAKGDSFLAEEAWNQAAASYKSILSGSGADDQTEAGAFFGLGVCIYRQGLEMDDQDAANASYFEANLSFLRVATVYRDQVRFVPRALYYSALCFNRSGGANRAKALVVAGRLQKRFPESSWTKKVKEDLGVR